MHYYFVELIMLKCRSYVECLLGMDVPTLVWFDVDKTFHAQQYHWHGLEVESTMGGFIDEKFFFGMVTSNLM